MEHAPEDGELEGDKTDDKSDDVKTRINEACYQCRTDNAVTQEKPYEKPALHLSGLPITGLVKIAGKQPEIDHAYYGAENNTEKEPADIKAPEYNHDTKRAEDYD